MKELGNLSIVCAQRPDVLMQIYNGTVSVHVGAGPSQATLHSAWNDDDEIHRIVREMSFGKYSGKETQDDECN